MCTNIDLPHTLQMLCKKSPIMQELCNVNLLVNKWDEIIELYSAIDPSAHWSLLLSLMPVHMFNPRGRCVMHFKHIIFRTTKLFLLIKNPIRLQHLGRVRGRNVSSASASCGKWGSKVDLPLRLQNHNGTQYCPPRTSTPLVMSTHKADDSPTKTYNGMANGFGPKTPFLIGVAGGTASGKVNTDRMPRMHENKRASVICILELLKCRETLARCSWLCEVYHDLLPLKQRKINIDNTARCVLCV